MTRAIFVISLVLKTIISATHEANIKVQVEQGWLQGEELELVTGDGKYFSFKGIPYAAPPVGKLRFKAPQPAIPWEGVRNSTQHGSKCIQFDIFTNKLVPASEDCLFLNVYTSNLNPKVPLPVMFFIHGGGFESDSGNVDNYGPDFLVGNGVVLVTINYRLEVLGFLSLDTEAVPGNAGMKDQVTALKWVKKNIEKFGGDPENITVFGQSAGSVSTVLHMVSPMSRGLFKRAISMSGVPSCDWAMAYQPKRRAFVLGKQLGFDTTDPENLLEFLQNVSAEKLTGVSPNVLASEEVSNILKMFHFAPVVERDFGQEHFLTENPEKLLMEGKVSQVDLMIGHSTSEGIGDLILFEDTFLKTYSQYAELLVPTKIQVKKNPEEVFKLSDMIRKHYFGTKSISKDTLQEFLDYINDSAYGYDIYRYINLLSKVLKRNTYVYKFTAVSTRNIYGKIGQKYNFTVAGHLDDTAYIFDPKHANLNIDKKSKEYKIVTQTVALFTNFAKYGNPTPDKSLGVTWTPFNNNSEAYMDIGEDLTPGQNLDADVAAFWKSVFDKAGLEF
ncbi:juvenile hormone esterase-like [Pectinophora gossypiella]|uniref:juvenile hormone esterase-like n=1 Tax=Pectinophora gossypiella TaxID=13191 RepID=UPI00214F4637|nr:juvenile hormone esterase-like [Pectinophora gossypiella]